MIRKNLDQVIADMRGEQPNDEAVRQAAKRVFRNVFDSAYLPERVARIKGCADFQALLPGYLGKTLSDARVSLLEDHIGQCVDCRRALREARTADRGQPHTPERRPVARVRKTRSWLPLAVAASLTVGIAVGITGAFNGLLPGQHAIRATVVSVQGTLYRVSDFGSSLLEAGALIRNGEELRTAKGSRAILRLANGAQVEMNERSDVSVSRGWRGTSVDVERGHIIVNAADRGQKTFFVAAGDMRVPVKNAVFSLNRGTKGSRIAMAKGFARVTDSAGTFELNAGQQRSTDYRLINASLTTEFAWSSNADYYLTLLNELSALQTQIQSIPGPDLRYASKLAGYLPENTVVYAAVPNVGGTLSEVKRIFEQRLSESEVLREWWQRQPASRNGELDQAFTEMSAISQYLGNEIVFSVVNSAPHEYSQPVFLAETARSGLREYLEQHAPAGLRVIDATSSAASVAPSKAKDGLFVSFAGDLVVASPDLKQVQGIAHRVTDPGAASLAQTPFYARLAQSYKAGVGYLLAINMEQMVSNSVNNPKEVPPGFQNAQYLVLEKRDLAGKTEMRASLSFAGAREGVASWLGAPGPMGSLDFVSPDASFAASFVMKDPRMVMQELLTYTSQSDAHAAERLSKMQEQLGVNLADDVAASFGGDATFAIDGTLLPVPAWKFAAEVYNAAQLQQTITTFVEHFNQHADANTGKFALSSEEVNGRTFYSLSNNKAPNLAAYYTFVDGYLVAAPSEGILLQAIHNRQAGYTLASSAAFQSQLPDDSYTNFSAIIYHHIGKSLSAIADQFKGSNALTAAQRQSLSALLANTAPGLICVYGEPNRIVAASKSSFLGFDLGTLAGIGEGRPLLPLIASSAGAFRSQALSQAKQYSQ
ncbi:MAG TPA: FecR domain-containing protein [Bryobacteraceae bacterium]|nr:FecR domain-containing protein [Bryobacteraceae bacterium]